MSSQQMKKKSRGTAPVPSRGSGDDRDTLALQGQKQCQDTKRQREPTGSLVSFSLAPGANEREKYQSATQRVRMGHFSHVSLHVHNPDT